MAENEWVKGFPAPVVVVDAKGMIVEMNPEAEEWYADRGGRDLLGTSLFDALPETARIKVKELLASKETNVYTFERDGVRKLVYQSPWYRDGAFAGLVQLLLVAPLEIPHYVRAPKG
ncbi:MAG: PAS domain-containing protein [Dehalococcoidia bacterium]|jgi:nitrogen-specific signal transduction histidine kinase